MALSGAVFLAGLTGLVGCSPAIPDPDARKYALPLDAPDPTPILALKTDWDCTGNLVPPTGWAQHTAYVPADVKNAVEVAAKDAEGGLVDRLCADVGRCASLEPLVSRWKIGITGGDPKALKGQDICAMAVISAEDLANWRRAEFQLGDFDKDLDAAIQSVWTQISNDKYADIKSQLIAIDRVIDAGTPGGDRAEWFIGKMGAAFSAADLTLAEIPKGWAGDGLPDGLDLLANATVSEREENGTPVLELIVEVRYRTESGLIAKRVASPVGLPKAAAPGLVGDPSPAITEGDGRVSVRVETRPGGSLCEGDYTQVWVHTDTDRYIRIFDLYGNDGAVLLFPNDTNPTGLVKAHTTFALGDAKGFRAVAAPGHQTERFLVLSAKAQDDLGAWSEAKAYCRVETDTAAELHRGAEIASDATISSTGFRILASGQGCGTSDVDTAAQFAALDALPVCNQGPQ